MRGLASDEQTAKSAVSASHSESSIQLHGSCQWTSGIGGGVPCRRKIAGCLKSIYQNSALNGSYGGSSFWDSELVQPVIRSCCSTAMAAQLCESLSATPQRHDRELHLAFNEGSARVAVEAMLDYFEPKKFSPLDALVHFCWLAKIHKLFLSLSSSLSLFVVYEIHHSIYIIKHT